tara:strand:+ start:1087 stop:1635 length:549 start_codon:yes stop_codon:yes gene_type:complete
MVGIPYFMSAQLDELQRNPRNDTSWLEGWIGFLIFNLGTWISIAVLDIMLLANDFKHADTWNHIIQTGAVVSVAVSGITIIAFFLIGLCTNEPFTSKPGYEAETLPPFATALIAGGLKATLGFTYVLLLTTGTSYASGHLDKDILQTLVALVALKHFGSAMAMANQRLHLFATNVPVVSATY